jgi:hypothetical protein
MATGYAICKGCGQAIWLSDYGWVREQVKGPDGIRCPMVPGSNIYWKHEPLLDEQGNPTVPKE